MIIFGTGSLSENVCKYINLDSIQCFIDNDSTKIGKIFLGKPIYSVEYLEGVDNQKIYIASTFYYEILSQLEKLGYVEESDIFNALTLIPYKIVKDIYSIDSDVEDEFVEILIKCKPYTMTSWERMYALYQSVIYIIENNIQGSFVECGVWRGGSARLIIETLNKLGIADRDFYLYDTFEGFDKSDISDVDIIFESEKTAIQELEELEFTRPTLWIDGELEKVRFNLTKTNYPSSKINYIKGKVEETIPTEIPTNIALLRLDTDIYSSTNHEMKYLYPLLESKGILIIDDYGYSLGAKKAVDDYFLENGIYPFLNKIDYTGRILVKV